MNFKFVSAFIIGIIVFITGVLFLNYSTADDDDILYPAEFRKEYRIYAVPMPEKVEFAGERVPLENFDTYESLDRELLANVYWQSQTLLVIKRAAKFFPIIEPILKKNNIPDDFKYLAVIESGLVNIKSPAGAAGYWQIMEATAKELGMIVNDEIDERYHIEKSTEAACKYLNKSYEKFGNWTLVAAAYNGGNSGVLRRANKQSESEYYDIHFADETGRYVFRIIAMKLIMQNPEQYGYIFREKDLYKLPEYETVTLDSSVKDLPSYANYYKTNFKVFRNINPWLRDTKVTLKPGQKIDVWIPKSRVIE